MRLLLALMLSLSLPAFAQHDPHAGHMAATKNAPLSDGLVKKIDAKAGEIVIQHGQLDSIGMPPMTMAFGVADKAWLGKLKAGDKIRFAAEMKGGNAIVSRYEMAK
ncbi:MAG: copper-binding protein [Dechloromonas sp.]|uniref:copper-binding protein n=1 Tax=Azonexaceae TaxID=2008795 RepID=UPI001CF8F9C7|nr:MULTISPECIES: copper-binding protein [Azonexaceae]MBT9519566.1 copper-binding protein [Dechloromonas sp.]UCV21637.1 copper-binding protein [Ferribacterium limneticum]